LVPDEPTVRLWSEHVEAATRNGSFNPASDTLVLDGIPRSPGQAKIMEGVLDVRLVLYLTCTDMDKMIARLQRRALRENRLDDANIAIIRQRLEVFERESKPVLDCYGPGRIQRIDSAQSPIAVLRDILIAVEKAVR
jgi:adenylate kinase